MQDEREHRVINLFRIADQLVKRSINRRVEGTGIYRSQHRLLMMLGKYPDSSQTEIAEKLEISPAAVAVSLKKLEKSGYISRQSHENDSRINHVVITGKGKQAIGKSCEYFREIELAFFEGFSEEEMDTMEQLFRKMIANGEKYYESLQVMEKQ